MQTKDTASKLKIYCYTALFLTLIATITRTLMYFFFYDAEIGYFSTNTPFPTILNIFLALSVFWFLSALIFIPKDTLPNRTPTPSGVGRSLSVLCALSLFLPIINSVRAFLSGTGNRIINIVIIFFSLIAVVYFIMFVFSDGKRSDSRVFLGFSVIFAAAIFIADMYFDSYTPMNCPVKVLSQLAILFIMLSFANDFRFELEKPMPKAYVATSLSACLLGLTSSISGIIGFIAGIIPKTRYFIYNVVLFSFCLFIMLRLIEYVKSVTLDTDTEVFVQSEQSEITDELTDDNNTGEANDNNNDSDNGTETN